MSKVNDWLETIQNLLYPPSCLLCGAAGQDRLDLCRACHQALPWIDKGCPLCGLPVPLANALCGRCLEHPPPFFRTRAPLHYAPPVAGLIAALKFGGRLACARLLGELLARQWMHLPRPDCLLPVPLHPDRQHRRGFNQALEIARPLSRRLEIPLQPRFCRRVRATVPQRQLDAGQRRGNLRGAFEASEKVEGHHIALIDDVMTTGATVREIASTLLKAGAAKVEVWVVARA